ncbi:MAG: hypothetical protein ACREBQ_08440, partial [Nitrososphaerales archaeon]
LILYEVAVQLKNLHGVLSLLRELCRGSCEVLKSLQQDRKGFYSKRARSSSRSFLVAFFHIL